MATVIWNNGLSGRYGSVLLINTLSQYDRFRVRERESGECEYRLGDAARTADGWVTLDDEHLSRIDWE